MIRKSDYLVCKMAFSHEEVESIARWLRARKVGGEMVAADEKVVEELLIRLDQHDEFVQERLAAIAALDEVAKIDFWPAIQAQADAELHQCKKGTTGKCCGKCKGHEKQSAADMVADIDLTDISRMAADVRAAVEPRAVYQVLRD